MPEAATVQSSVADVIAAAPRNSIADRTMTLSVEFSVFGDKKQGNIQLVSTDTNKQWLSVTKRLMRSPKLKAVNAIKADVKKELKMMSGTNIMKSGFFLIPIGLVRQAIVMLREAEAKWGPAVDAFIDEYTEAYQPDPETGQRFKAFADELKGQFDIRNYPSPSAMRAKFSFAYQFVSFAAPGALEGIAPELFEEEVERNRAMFAEAQDQFRTALRLRLAGFFDDLTAQLQPTSDGKRRRLFRSTVDRLNRAIEMFAAQNEVANDAELAAVIERGRLALEGFDVNQVKDDDALRARIAANLAAVSGSLHAMTVDEDTRQLHFEDDDDEPTDDPTGPSVEPSGEATA